MTSDKQFKEACLKTSLKISQALPLYSEKGAINERLSNNFGDRYLVPLAAFNQKNATEEDWFILFFALKVAVVLAEKAKIMEHAVDILTSGQDSLIKISSHAAKDGVWQFGAHAFAVKSAFKLLRLQRQAATPTTLWQAIALVVNNDQKSLDAVAA